MAVEFGLDLSAFPQSDGVYLISPPRQFAGGEEVYDEHIGGAHGEDRLRGGRGAWQLIAHYATRPVRTLLEVGAGGGACSLGLVAAASGVQTIVTDTSPTFLQMIRRKMIHAGLSMQDTRFATLAGEDLHRLCACRVDAIAIASALHHVSDWRRFLQDAATLIRPGGVLVIQEPCREGNLMMGMALDVVLSPLWPRDVLDHADVERISRCRDSIYHLADSTIEKQGEDKHSFLVTELIAGAEAAGFVGTAFYGNRHFCDLADTDLSKPQGSCSFVDYLDSFLEMHQRVTASGMQTLRQRLFPILQRIDMRFRAGDGAPLLGCMVFRR
jgi:2-polyprenyl-3-methyl-5-hydroxy-6-metoxy-1,4-benzoquinol methylase